jgi:hypothetical protein
MSPMSPMPASLSPLPTSLDSSLPPEKFELKLAHHAGELSPPDYAGSDESPPFAAILAHLTGQARATAGRPKKGKTIGKTNGKTKGKTKGKIKGSRA